MGACRWLLSKFSFYYGWRLFLSFETPLYKHMKHCQQHSIWSMLWTRAMPMH